MLLADNVIPIGGITKLDIPADQVLKNNIGEFESVVLMGWNKDGEEVFASSIADGGDVIWLLERMKLKLLRTVDD